MRAVGRSDKGPFADPMRGLFHHNRQICEDWPCQQHFAQAKGLNPGGARPAIAGSPAGQARGTMVARSNGNAGKVVTGEVRSPPRSKSIRRSKALERIKGNLSNTLSRILR
jgi:hypothetical protein